MKYFGGAQTLCSPFKIQMTLMLFTSVLPFVVLSPAPKTLLQA